MAFSYTTTGSKDLGGAKLIHGTWACDGGTSSGTITWGGTRSGNQGITQTIVDHSVSNSVTASSVTCSKITTTGTIAVTCTANDAGWWSVTVL